MAFDPVRGRIRYTYGDTSLGLVRAGLIFTEPFRFCCLLSATQFAIRRALEIARAREIPEIEEFRGPGNDLDTFAYVNGIPARMCPRSYRVFNAVNIRTRYTHGYLPRFRDADFIVPDDISQIHPGPVIHFLFQMVEVTRCWKKKKGSNSCYTSNKNIGNFDYPL